MTPSGGSLTRPVDTPPAPSVRCGPVRPSTRRDTRQPEPLYPDEVNPTMPIALSDGALEWLRTSGIRIAAVIVVAVILSRIGTLAVRRLRKRIEGDPRATGEISLQRPHLWSRRWPPR